MNFVNNWSAPIELAAGVTSVSLNLPDGTYRPTLTDSAASATRWEIVDAVVAGGVATLTRGVEGTLDQAWPSGSVIFIGVTAGFLSAIQSSGSSVSVGTAEFVFDDETASFVVADGVGLLYLGQDGSPPLEGLTVTLPDLAPGLQLKGRTFELQVDGDGNYVIDLDLSKTIAAANADSVQFWTKGAAQIVSGAVRFQLTGGDRFTVTAMGIFEIGGARLLRVELVQVDGFFMVSNIN